jgi:hypothetical protein
MITIPIWYFVLLVLYVVVCQTLLSCEIGRRLKLWQLQRKRLRAIKIKPHEETSPCQNQDSYDPIHPTSNIQFQQQTNNCRTSNPNYDEDQTFPIGILITHANKLFGKLRQSIRRLNKACQPKPKRTYLLTRFPDRDTA